MGLHKKLHIKPCLAVLWSKKCLLIFSHQQCAIIWELKLPKIFQMLPKSRIPSFFLLKSDVFKITPCLSSLHALLKQFFVVFQWPPQTLVLLSFKLPQAKIFFESLLCNFSGTCLERVALPEIATACLYNFELSTWDFEIFVGME